MSVLFLSSSASLFLPVSFSPRHYCVVESPVVRNDAGEVQFDENGQAKLVHADLDIRLARNDQAPFPLYPGEILRQVKSSLRFRSPSSDRFSLPFSPSLL